MKSHNRDAGLSSASNFSSLARNGNRFLKKAQNEAPDISPAKNSKCSSPLKKTPLSPQWMEPGTFQSPQKLNNSEKENFEVKPQSKTIADFKTDLTSGSFSQIDAHIERALNFHKKKISGQKTQMKVDLASFISKENQDDVTEGGITHGFPSEITNIAAQKDFSGFGGFLPPPEDEDLRSEANQYSELSFKDDHFESMKQDLNHSSPIKIPRRNLDAEEEECYRNFKMPKQAEEELEEEPELDQEEKLELDQEVEEQDLYSQPYTLDLQKAKENYERMTDFSAEKRLSNHHFINKTELKSALNHQISERIFDKSPENVSPKAGSLQKIRSLENNSGLKSAEKREELSDRVSKFYFQKQSNFSNNVEAYDLVRQNLFPAFLNDKEKDKDRIVQERSGSKTSKILTPSKIINELLDRTDSVTKIRKPRPIIQEEEENEPMEEFWKAMNQDVHEEAKKHQKENFIKGLFKQREEYLQSETKNIIHSESKSDLIEPSDEKMKSVYPKIGYHNLGKGLIQERLQETKIERSAKKSKARRKSIKSSAKPKKTAVAKKPAEPVATPDKLMIKNYKKKNGLPQDQEKEENIKQVPKANMKLVRTYRNKSQKRKEKSKKRLKADQTVGLSQSMANFSKIPKENQGDFSRRALEWKNSRDLKVESKRKQAYKDELSGCIFAPDLTKTMKSDGLPLKSLIHQDHNQTQAVMKQVDYLCPSINAKRLDKRAKMRLKFSNKNPPKGSKTHRCVKGKYAKTDMIAL